MDFRTIPIDVTLLDTLHDLLDFSDETSDHFHHAPSRAYIRDAKAIAATPADVKELPEAFVFVVDMPGLKRDQIKVQVEDDNMLVVSGERRREKEKDQGVRYIKMGRRLGKYLVNFQLPETADTDSIAASYQNGVLTVTVQKKPPPEPKKPKTVEVKIAS